MTERAHLRMHEMSENPEIARGVIGAVVLDLIRSGKDVSTAAIIEALEAIAVGKEARPGLNELLAKGALKVISDLRPREAGSA
ncbi:hypothetical protein [Halodurantibacterium flavum]|uniref:Uncharacterized protein n=1 Tax=Halodurantibacterium flavum TaxID=1382802 RepID=A0ABW4SAT0_9RHOB